MNIPRMNYRQYRKARRLTHECCNYCDGNCLLLDDGYDPCPCPQTLTCSLLCRYFRSAVLPGDPELHREIAASDHRRRCQECGKPFAPRFPNTRYCPSSAARRTRRHKRAWAAKNRGRA